MTDKANLFIVGGGIDGAALARDAAGRGLSTAPTGKGDDGHATSSAFRSHPAASEAAQ